MTDADPRTLHIEVAYAWPDRQILRSVRLADGATVREALEASGIRELIREQEPGYEIREDRVGVFGRRVTLADPVRDGDRVALYRPLQEDPKEARRMRAEADRVAEKGRK